MRSLIFLICFISALAKAAEIRPFISDGCSAFPDGTLKQSELWLSCCKTHDFSYWQGGAYGERLEADKKLRQCVEQAGEPEIALLMMAGVRVGGTPYFPTRFRWGYGWPYFRGYKKITHQERKMIGTVLNGI